MRPALNGTRLAAAARALQWSLLGLAAVIAGLFITWRALAAVDFAYPVFYDWLGIEQTIAANGPQNAQRPHFHHTSRAERERLFGAIVEAVRHEGKGLAAMTYNRPDGRPIGRMLTRAEIRHLQDVAWLVGLFERAGWIALAALVLLAGWSVLQSQQPPPLWRFAAGLVGVTVLAAATVMLIGPVAVFYWAHERIFPAEHQWFFWYEESLMSMMMQAPNLFGAIALLWVPLAVAAACGLWLGLRRLAGRRAGA